MTWVPDTIFIGAYFRILSLPKSASPGFAVKRADVDGLVHPGFGLLALAVGIILVRVDRQRDVIAPVGPLASTSRRSPSGRRA